MEELVCVKIFSNRIGAELAKTKLEANGIKSVVDIDDAGGMYPSLGNQSGAKLLVKKNDVEKVNMLL